MFGRPTAQVLVVLGGGVAVALWCRASGGGKKYDDEPITTMSLSTQDDATSNPINEHTVTSHGGARVVDV